MQARAFNTIVVDKKKGLFTKTSINTLKLKDEVNYYLSLPYQLVNFFPRLLSYTKNFTSYTLEHVPFKDLSSLFVNNQIPLAEGKVILAHLFNKLDEIHLFQLYRIAPSKISNFYIQKTIKRIYSLKSNPSLLPLLEGNDIIVNGEKYKTFKSLQNKFIKAFQEVEAEQPFLTAIHGDFCFSNILYCSRTKAIKLIDPRGDFIEKGIYGDPRYDYAKLLHCLHGRYDFIVNERYDFKEINPKEFLLKKRSSLLLKSLLEEYHILLRNRGININFLYLLEASLFLSMVPLHYDSLQRQKALLITGLKILNKFFEGKYENLH